MTSDPDDSGTMQVAGDGEGPRLGWDAEELFVHEGPRRRLYRRLQSWYRQEKLGAPYGWTRSRAATATRPAAPARPVGSLLDPSWLQAHPDANFLPYSGISAAILAYVNAREPQVRHAGGTLEPVRLRTNLLSSMPLCFNLFAPLRSNPEVAVDLLRRGLGVDAVELASVAGIDGIECEWAPPPAVGLGDRTAFDAVVAYRDSRGSVCLLGIETKYTEPFSPTPYGRPGDPRQAQRRASYQRWTAAGWFRPGAEDRLYRPVTNQLWRNVMLGVACEQLPDVHRVDIAVIALHSDPHAAAATAGVQADLCEPDRLRALPLERIVRLAEGGDLHQWAAAFRERYLVTTPVITADVVDRDGLQRRIDELFPDGCAVAYDIGDETPHVLHCPHPVVQLVDHHLELFLWREDNWSGSYPVIDHGEVTDASGTTLVVDGGRFVLASVTDPGLRRNLRSRRLPLEEFRRVRDGVGS